jgi:hypothetical protein
MPRQALQSSDHAEHSVRRKQAGIKWPGPSLTASHMALLIPRLAGGVDQMVTFIHDPSEPGVVWMRNGSLPLHAVPLWPFRGGMLWVT